MVEKFEELSFTISNGCIGSYVIGGKIEVFIGETKLLFYVKHAVKDETLVPIEIDIENETSKVVYSHSEENHLILIYPVPAKVRSIRNELGLNEDMFRCPTSTHHLSRIFFALSTPVTEKLSKNISYIFYQKIDSISLEKSKQLFKIYEELNLITHLPTVKEPQKVDYIILTYPPNTRGGVSIFMNDFMDLSPGTYLNDAIIHFYIKYIVHEKLSEDQRKRVHAFDSFFYKKLISALDQEELQNKRMSVEDKALIMYSRVSKWDEKINLLEKDFIFVPILQHDHWFLAVICYPRLIGKTLHYDTHVEINVKYDKFSPIIQPCILIFDSLGMDRPHVIKNLRLFLSQRCKAMDTRFELLNFDKNNMPGCYVKVPFQQNYYDCGIYLLQYVENFFSNPIKDYRLPIKNLTKWFDLDVILHKRKFLRDLIELLVQRYEPEKLPLPYINFDNNIMNYEETHNLTSEKGNTTNDANCNLIDLDNPVEKSIFLFELMRII
uniref:CSON007014 protein n=1 Tax=Culicoides sonorensis TaxID=179676 RepID=A0A336MTG5_CULSO